MRRLLAATITTTLLLGTAGIAAVGAQARASLPAEEQIAVAFLDAGGGLREAPYFNIKGASPGMTPRSQIVVVHNDGRGVVTHDLALTITSATEPHFVGDVLIMTVTSLDSGAVTYEGPLVDQQRVGSSLLAPGEDARYRVSVAWPDRGSDDNVYQGQTTSFTFTAAARSTATPR